MASWVSMQNTLREEAIGFCNAVKVDGKYPREGDIFSASWHIQQSRDGLQLEAQKTDAAGQTVTLVGDAEKNQGCANFFTLKSPQSQPFSYVKHSITHPKFAICLPPPPCRMNDDFEVYCRQPKKIVSIPTQAKAVCDVECPYVWQEHAENCMRDLGIKFCSQPLEEQGRDNEIFNASWSITQTRDELKLIATKTNAAGEIFAINATCGPLGRQILHIEETSSCPDFQPIKRTVSFLPAQETPPEGVAVDPPYMGRSMSFRIYRKQ